ncbi:hypothetical protein ACIRL0_27415 [Streptomyces sp. NPDC102365]|jgi:hypothetical protein|uniref:hypothetical protein n=1 Tax=Streptomyces sp. NPDC102365 TaxID=3366162 RepID=UPI003816B4F4
MNTTQLEGLIGMLFVLGILVLLVLPSVFGIVRDRRVDRQLREAEQGPAKERGPSGDQKSSSRSTVPSTATWYAEGRRSKKLVSS